MTDSKYLVDKEMIDFVVSIILEKYPKEENDSKLRDIAIIAIQNDLINDEKWLEARIKGKSKKNHPVFVKIKKKQISAMKEKYGEEYLSLLKTRLNDITKIHTRWAWKFLNTVKRIGYDKVIEQKEVYKFVTEHEFFEIAERKEKRLIKKQKAREKKHLQSSENLTTTKTTATKVYRGCNDLTL